MTAWHRGYVADSPYTFAYQGAQAPGNLALICALMGVAWQPAARMVVVDIGCGRGCTVNTLAAANPGWEVFGLDYNPAHIAEAADIAERASIENATFMEVDLATMTDVEIDELPPIDVASLHGVWTWVSDSVRQGIVRLLSRRLKPGGLVYVGYNVLPGFGADMALQRLFRHLASQQLTGSSSERAQAAIVAIRDLHATKPVNLSSTLMLRRLTEDETPLDPAYLAHEFLTEHWRPVFFEDLCADLSAAKLDYVGSATLHENVPDMLFEPPQRAIYDAMPTGTAREFIKDLCLQRPFRRDVFVRGMRRTDPGPALERLVLAACRHLGDESPKLGVPVGAAELSPDLWQPIAAALNEGPQTLGLLRSLPQGRMPNAAELLVLLAGTGLVVPALREAAATQTTQRFNRVIAETYAAEGRQGGQYAMASPVVAAGLPCSWLELALAVQPETAQPAPDIAALTERLLPGLSEEGGEKARSWIAELLRERPAIWRRFGII